MKKITTTLGAIYGLWAIILGALGAHAFKKILLPYKLASLEIGTKYLMFAALFLVLIGSTFSFTKKIEKFIAIFMSLGAFLFSGSIYLLAFQTTWRVNLSFIWPVTPIGGLMMLTSWGLLVINFIKAKS